MFRKRQDILAQRFQTVLDGDAGSGLLLLLVRLIEIFDLRELGAVHDLLFQFIRQLALYFDQGDDAFFSLSEIEFIFILLLDV